MLELITPLILTYNEAINIERTLSQLAWAKKIVVIDSYSTDNTLNIIKSYPQTKIFSRKFDTFANQCNYGLEQIDSEWILSIDADYVLSDELIAEIDLLSNKNLADGYFVNFKYCIFGKPLKGTLLPPRQVLFRKNKAHYINDGHAHKVMVKGISNYLRSYIYHDDRKSLSRWLQAQDRYMISEASKLLTISSSELSLGDRIRSKKIIAPFVIFFYCLILKEGILDGWRGWYYAFQRMLAEIILSIRLIEAETNIK
jgi:glycosyltransferase involved in cell wall biosynthesis